MTTDSFLELVIEAHQSGLETTIDQVRRLPEFSTLGVMAACLEIEKKLEEKGLAITPPVLEGEIDQPRVISRKKSPEKYNSALEEAIAAGEGQEVEYKESIYLKKDVYGNNNVARQYWVTEDLIFECIKTICAFLNSDGGTLLIGVDDEGSICGIDCELEFIPGPAESLDSWELFFSSCLEKYIYDFRSCIGYLSRKMVKVGELTVCVVLVRPRRQGITVCKRPKQMDDEIVYVRNGNSSAQIKARAIESLIRNWLE